MPLLLEVFPQLDVVIDLAVKGNANAPVRRPLRLVTRWAEIDDRESAMGEADTVRVGLRKIQMLMARYAVSAVLGHEIACQPVARIDECETFVVRTSMSHLEDAFPNSMKLVLNGSVKHVAGYAAHIWLGGAVFGQTTLIGVEIRLILQATAVRSFLELVVESARMDPGARDILNESARCFSMGQFKE
jgi:hypothetical protein